MSVAENIERDLNHYAEFFDLIYFDLDGHWKRVRGGAYGTELKTKKDAEEFLELFRRGREDWDLRIAQFTEHTFVDLV